MIRNQKSFKSRNIELFVLALSPGMLAVISLLTLTNVYAGGPRLDSPESDNPLVGECWVSGFDDGAKNDWSDSRSEECGQENALLDGTNVYRQGFDAGLVCLNPDLSESISNDCDAARD
jgi:hypothetical protein